jgi:hypothetical protein
VRTTVYSAEPTCIDRSRFSCFFATSRPRRAGWPWRCAPRAVEVALVALVLAELFLDGLELLAEHVLALVLAHLLLDLGVDALAHLEDLQLPGEQLEHLRMRSFTSTVSMSWAFSSTGASRFAATRSASAPGLLDGVDERLRLARQLGHELDDLLGDVAQAHRQGLGLHVVDLTAPRSCAPSSPSCRARAG